MKKKLTTIIGLLMPLLMLAQGWPSNYGGVMLQGFYWDSYTPTKWTRLTAQADELAQYFDLVWIPQSARAKSSPSMGYDPLYWFSNYESSFGSESELRTMISTFKQKGLGTIGDVVINHRGNVSNWVDFPAETYNGVTYQLRSTDICKNDDGGATQSWANQNGYSLSANNDTGEDWSGMRDLDHKSENVQENVKAYLNMLLNDLGYTGFRYDMVKGFTSSFIGLYNSIAQPEFSVGEYWDGNPSNVQNWINGTKVESKVQSAAFDFPFRYTARDVVNDKTKKWTALGGNSVASNSSYRRYAVTFIENHDTEKRSNADQDPIKADTLGLNAYMLAMPGTPCVFLKHWIDCKQDIKGMIDVRKAVGIKNTSNYLPFRSNKEYYAVITTGANGKLLTVVGNTDHENILDAIDTDIWIAVAEGYHYRYYMDAALEMPWIDKASGTYDNSVTVKVTAVSENPSAQLVYTTDGSAPTAINGTIVASGTVLRLRESMTLNVGLLIESNVTKVITREYDLLKLNDYTDGLRYLLDSETHTAIVVFDNSYIQFTDLVIPATIDVDGEQYTVTGIADGAFRGCNLRSVSIYANITEGNGGFNNCSVGTLYVADNVTTMLGLGINPSTIYCFGLTPPVCDDNTFSAYDAALHVPIQVTADYFMADIWCNFNNINSDAGEQPNSLSLNQENATIDLGETLQLSATANPNNVVPILWQSTNTEVATVTDNGLVTALATGEADIVVTCMGLRKQCHVIVQEAAIVATINQHELILDRGSETTLTATTSPVLTNINWNSTNTDIVSVTAVNGLALVHAVAPGEALIIATPEGDNVVPDTCRVTVNEITIVVSIDQHQLRMKRSDTAYLTAMTSPIEATVNWRSTDANVALVRVVNGRALVLANRPGEAFIIATAEGEQVQPDTCRVTVKRPKGDANNDGLVDVTDVNEVVNIILGKVENAEINSFADVNGDGTIDVTDVNIIVNAILGKVDLDMPKLLTYTVNGVTFNMVEVEGDSFTMGATAEQGSDAGENEFPTHQVTLSSYSIGQTEVTQELWVAVMGSNPSYFSTNNSYAENLQRPVEKVNWSDCQTFITKLNQLTGKNFRLPTEAEWEYAARGGNKSQGYKYAGSNTVGDVAWYSDNAYHVGSANPDYGTHSVATKFPNELGLYDMSGNVWEWCQDWYGSYNSDAQTNPVGPTSGSSRVSRGGSWNSNARGCRVSYHSGDAPTTSGDLGLRLAL